MIIIYIYKTKRERRYQENTFFTPIFRPELGVPQESAICIIFYIDTQMSRLPVLLVMRVANSLHINLPVSMPPLSPPSHPQPPDYFLKPARRSSGKFLY